MGLKSLYCNFFYLSLPCRRYLASELRSINVDRVFKCRHLGCLTVEGLDESRKGRGGGGGGEEILQPVILSIGVPVDLLQPSARFPIQDGGRNSRTKDYSAPPQNTPAMQATFILLIVILEEKIFSNVRHLCTLPAGSSLELSHSSHLSSHWIQNV